MKYFPFLPYQTSFPKILILGMEIRTNVYYGRLLKETHPEVVLFISVIS